MTVEQEIFEERVNRAEEVMKKAKNVRRAEFRITIDRTCVPGLEYTIEEDITPPSEKILPNPALDVKPQHLMEAIKK